MSLPDMHIYVSSLEWMSWKNAVQTLMLNGFWYSLIQTVDKKVIGNKSIASCQLVITVLVDPFMRLWTWTF